MFIVEGMKHQEETDNQLLWNLQILTEVKLKCNEMLRTTFVHFVNNLVSFLVFSADCSLQWIKDTCLQERDYQDTQISHTPEEQRSSYSCCKGTCIH